jgi:toxin ParE1/3/4
VAGRAAFHPAAEAELLAAAEFYEARAPRLGLDFLAEVERVAARAAAQPKLGAPYAGGTRRLMARRFPYAVVYRERGGGIEIVAVAHGGRRPGYWRERL